MVKSQEALAIAYATAFPIVGITLVNVYMYFDWQNSIINAFVIEYFDLTAVFQIRRARGPSALEN